MSFNMNKIRIDSKTIVPDKSYSGKEVLRLLDISFKNGQRNAKMEMLRHPDSQIDDLRVKLDCVNCKCVELEQRNNKLKKELDDAKMRESALNTQIKRLACLLDGYQYCINKLSGRTE